MSVALSAANESAALMDVGEVGRMFGCSARHVYRMSDAGKMPAPVKLGSLVRWNRSTIENWIEQGCPSCRKAKGAQ